MAVAGVVLVVGGPALVVYVTPTHEELFKKFNPELQKRSLEQRDERLRQHYEFVTKLKEYSKSDKPIWVVAKEAEAKEREAAKQEQLRRDEEAKQLKEEIRKQSTGSD